LLGLDLSGFDVLIRMRLAGARGAGRRVRLVSERLVVSRGISGVSALVVRIRPLGRVGIGRRIVQLVVRIAVVAWRWGVTFFEVHGAPVQCMGACAGVGMSSSNSQKSRAITGTDTL